MNALMTQRTAVLARRLTLLLLLLLLIGCALAAVIRKRQSLEEMLGYHTRIKANLAAMQESNQRIQGQLDQFRARLGADPQTTRELKLYRRLDQVRTALKPLEMQVLALDTSNNAARVPFSLKLPISSYDAAVNAMGELQTASLPFVVFNGVHFSDAANGSFTVEGTVLLPPVPEKVP